MAYLCNICRCLSFLGSFNCTKAYCSTFFPSLHSLTLQPWSARNKMTGNSTVVITQGQCPLTKFVSNTHLQWKKNYPYAFTVRGKKKMTKHLKWAQQYLKWWHYWQNPQHNGGPLMLPCRQGRASSEWLPQGTALHPQSHLQSIKVQGITVKKTDLCQQKLHSVIYNTGWPETAPHIINQTYNHRWRKLLHFTQVKKCLLPHSEVIKSEF